MKCGGCEFDAQIISSLSISAMQASLFFFFFFSLFSLFPCFSRFPFLSIDTILDQSSPLHWPLTTRRTTPFHRLDGNTAGATDPSSSFTKRAKERGREIRGFEMYISREHVASLSLENHCCKVSMWPCIWFIPYQAVFSVELLEDLILKLSGSVFTQLYSTGGA